MTMAFFYLALLLTKPEVELAMDHPGLYKMFYLPAPTKEMKKLVNEDLGSDEWKVREAASDKLKGMGWKALAALEMGLKNEDLEIRTRCRRAREHILGFYMESYPSVFKFDKSEFKLGNGKKIKIDPALAERIYKQCWEDYKAEQLKSNGWCPPDTVYNWEVGPRATCKLVEALVIMGVNRDDLKKSLEGIEKNDMKLPEGITEYDRSYCGNPPPNPVRRLLRMPRLLPFFP